VSFVSPHHENSFYTLKLTLKEVFMKKRLMFTLFVMCFGLVEFAEANPTAAIPDVAVMSGRDDGKYDVFCKNGNRELITDLDLRLNNVCPNLRESKRTNILSLQRREDGKFDVVCRDLRKLVSEESEIKMGTACDPRVPRISLEDGYYKPTSGHMSYYPHTITTTHDGDLKSLLIRIENGWNCKMDCAGAVCKGVSGSSSCGKYILEVQAPKKYRFTDKVDTAIFEKQ
jgi:hypothetical protein